MAISQKTLDLTTANTGADAEKLLFSASKYPDIDMSVVVNTLKGRQRIATKIPSWAGAESLLYPTVLCTQQCSSEYTALYKASLAKELAAAQSGRQSVSIADLTGGLGVDSWAFSRYFRQVLFNEADKLLASAAQHNFEILGCINISTTNRSLVPQDRRDRQDNSGSLTEILGDFHPDIIYLDPGRRSHEGKKVFLLEDCSPDVLSLKEELLSCAPLILVKLSPMADISMLMRRLGANLSQIHVVACSGECKELLAVLQRGYTGSVGLTINEDGATLSFKLMEDRTLIHDDQVIADYNCNIGALPERGQILYEPGKAISKAGIFNYPRSLGYIQLAPHTHLYVVPAGICKDDMSSQSGSVQFLPGKYFLIDDVRPLQSSTIKELSRQGPDAEVSAHNVRISSDELRARLHAKSSATSHIFAASTAHGNLLIFTRRIKWPTQSIRP